VDYIKKRSSFFFFLFFLISNLLGDPSYMGDKMFIMQIIGWWELTPDADHAIMWAYDKMHAGFKVQVEWGIGGLKKNGGASWKGLIQPN
jgi:hypothetical protein